MFGFRLNPGDVVGEGGALGIAPIRGATVRVRWRVLPGDCGFGSSRFVNLNWKHDNGGMWD